MFSKLQKFSFIFLFISLHFSALGFLQNSTCVRDIKKYTSHLFLGTMSLKKYKRYFTCVHDGLDLMIQHFTHDPSRDYFTKQEIISYLRFQFKFTEKESEETIVKIFAFKKLVIGGHEDRLSDKELLHIYNLIYDYEKFFLLIRKEIPVFRKVLLNEKKESFSKERFERSLKQLQYGFFILKDALQREGLVYSLSDLDKTYVYLHQANLINKEEIDSWKSFSEIIYEWGQGVFGAGASIEGKVWNHFFGSLQNLVSQYFYYKLYVAGKDISDVTVFGHLLKSFNFFLSSLEYVKFNPKQKGFPLHRLDKILRVVFNEIKNQEKSHFDSSYLSFLTHEKRQPMVLLIRILTCYSLRPVSKECFVHWGSQDSQPVVSYQFPDGEFHFYKDQQKWVLNEKKNFYIHPEQIVYLKDWVSYWFLSIQNLKKDFFSAYSNKKLLLKSWFNDFFDLDSKGQIQFGGLVKEKGFSFEMARSFTQNDALIRLFFSLYGSKNQEGIPSNYFQNIQLQLSPENWEEIILRFSPLIISLYSDGYDPSFKNQFSILLNYADQLLNTSNQDNQLDYEELIDLSFHLPSAVESSQRAFIELENYCGISKKSDCVSQILVREPVFLDNFFHLKSYLLAEDLRTYQSIVKKLLPERAVEGFYDLMQFYLFIQMIESKFYFLDKDKSFDLNLKEISPLFKGLSKELVKSVPFLLNEDQAIAFLTYIAEKRKVPFFPFKDSPYVFEDLDFIHWVLHPEQWSSLSFSRMKALSLVVDLYEFYTQAQ